jgi:hypothetical protein
MIEADVTTLMRRAWLTASDYMRFGVQEIDAQFGPGYAKAHPELLAAFMRTAAADFGASIIAKEIGGAIDSLSATIEVWVGSGLSDLRDTLADKGS